jgi:hypothetical protein
MTFYSLNVRVYDREGIHKPDHDLNIADINHPELEAAIRRIIRLLESGAAARMLIGRNLDP